MVAGVRRGGNPVDFHIVGPGKALVVGVEGLEHEHIVPRVTGGHNGKGNGFTAPVGDKNIVQGIVHIPGFIISLDGFQQFGIPLGFSIGHHFGMVGGHPFKETFRGGDIRLSDIQMIDLFGLFHPVGNRRQFPDGGCGNVQRPLGNVHGSCSSLQ